MYDFKFFILIDFLTEILFQKIAQACVFIACKSDESSRRANDIAKSWLYKPNQTLSEKRIVSNLR